MLVRTLRLWSRLFHNAIQAFDTAPTTRACAFVRAFACVECACAGTQIVSIISPASGSGTLILTHLSQEQG